MLTFLHWFLVLFFMAKAGIAEGEEGNSVILLWAKSEKIVWPLHGASHPCDTINYKCKQVVEELVCWYNFPSHSLYVFSDMLNFCIIWSTCNITMKIFEKGFPPTFYTGLETSLCFHWTISHYTVCKRCSFLHCSALLQLLSHPQKASPRVMKPMQRSSHTG